MKFSRNLFFAMKTIISSPNAPAALGPYSQAVKVGNTIYLSGSLGVIPSTGAFIGDDIESQTKQAMVNIGDILKAAGCTYDNIVKSTVLLADINDFQKMNEVYKTFFTKDYPARSAFQVAALPKAARVEIEVIAYKE
uniref:2-iminobutanoate/2-iminopropanoate deaminase n=1 Tax=Parastrongyloides trichosuri TaxID=131310 RepID=A0A0N4ZER3_PARTI